MDDADRRVVVRWRDAGFGEPVVGAAVARPLYGGIVLGPHASLKFDPQAVQRRGPEPCRAWPLGDAVATPPARPLTLPERSMPSSLVRPVRTAS